MSNAQNAYQAMRTNVNIFKRVPYNSLRTYISEPILSIGIEIESQDNLGSKSTLSTPHRLATQLSILKKQC